MAPWTHVVTYDPVQINSVLDKCSGHTATESSTTETSETPTEPEEVLRNTERVVRKFLRATEINENTLRQAIGPFANTFFRDYLSVLMEAEVLKEVQYLGHGKQRRFRLGAPLQRVNEALKKSEGRFDRFIAEFHSVTRG